MRWTKAGLVDLIYLPQRSGSNTLDRAALRFAYENWRTDPRHRRQGRGVHEGHYFHAPVDPVSAEGSIHLATERAAVVRCFPVMRGLRPHLGTEAEFVFRVERQQAQGYRLAFLEVGEVVRAVAGFRVGEKLSAGRFLYVDDLATREEDRSKGYGGQLFDWLVDRARVEGCAQLQLDSGVWRHGAHRFYLGKRMEITCHHFDLKLGA